MDWLRTVYADKKLESYARQLAGIIFTRFTDRGRASFYDSDCTAFLDFTAGDISNLREQLVDRGYLKKIPNGSRPGYRLTFGKARRA